MNIYVILSIVDLDECWNGTTLTYHIHWFCAIAEKINRQREWNIDANMCNVCGSILLKCINIHELNYDFAGTPKHQLHKNIGSRYCFWFPFIPSNRYSNYLIEIYIVRLHVQLPIIYIDFGRFRIFGCLIIGPY